MPRPDRSTVRRMARIAAIVLFLSPAARGQDEPPGREENYVAAHFTKYEYRIAMRDGVRLFTTVYVPKDRSKRHPILLTRTPYSVAPYGVDQYEHEVGPSSQFTRAGYIVAYQDVRGCYMSEGDFVDVRPQKPGKGPKESDESSDAYDTIDWLVKHVRNNNGKVGVWGISYPGFYAAAAAIDAHPALKAVSPQAPLVDWFLGDDTHHNGALMLHQEFNFDAVYGLPRTGLTTRPHGPAFEHGTNDAYQFFLRLGPLPRVNDLYFHGKHKFWDDVMSHGTYDDFWKARNLLPHLKEVKPAMMTVGGWFDAEDLYGPLHTFAQIEKSSKTENLLVMGPWVHGGWSYGEGATLGHVTFRSKTAEHYRETIEFPFFEHHLQDVAPDLDDDEKPIWEPHKVKIFETGRNEWHGLETWPPKEAKPKSLYLRPGGKLGFDPPDAGGAEFDEYISDPARPVPYTTAIAKDCPPTFMVEDQRFASRRTDVLTYQTEVLSEDVTVAGPILAELVASTTGTDADLVVKLIDVYPEDLPDPVPNPTGVRMGGHQQLVRGEVMRGKFRKSFEAPEPFRPGEPTAVSFTLQDVYHTFRPGHRIMVQVQSTWFPLVDRNPQTFVDIYHAKQDDFRKATQRVYHAPGRASRLEVRVLP
jgi:putative CocE/NonD family hydrolase